MSASIEIVEVEHGSERYRETVALRFRILREPLGLSFSEEQLALESSDIHLAAVMGMVVVGCLVLSPQDSGAVKMRQVAVDPALRGGGIGARLVAESERTAISRGFGSMILSARSTAVSFYIQLGYAVEGEPYEEVTIPHMKMVKTLCR